MKRINLCTIARFTAVILLLGTVACAPGKKQGVKVTVLHWNDFHAMNTARSMVIDGDTLMVGGSANLGGYLDHFRETLAPTISLNAGDDFQGTPISSVTQGRSQIELLNLLKPDAFTVGNHEFDYGVASLREVLKTAQFPVLMGNVVLEDTGQLLFPADTVLTVDGVKIGVIGVLLDGLKEVTTRKATDGLKVLSSIETVRQSLKRLEPITDIQIALTHEGVYSDSVLAASIGPELELIIGGHSHTVLKQPKWVNGVPILQAGSKGKYLGIAELEIDTVENKLLNINEHLELIVQGKYPPDPEIAAVVKAQESQLAEKLDVVVARLKTDWVRSYRSESNIGDFVADAYRQSTGADIACINSGGLRKNLSAGDIRVRDLYEISPFANELVRLRLKGKDVETIIRTQAMKKRFLQISGLKYHVKSGKILQATVNGVPLDTSKIYSLVTVNYVSDHMDSYFGLSPDEHPVENLGLVDLDVLLEETKRAGVIRSTIEGRSVIE